MHVGEKVCLLAEISIVNLTITDCFEVRRKDLYPLSR